MLTINIYEHAPGQFDAGYSVQMYEGQRQGAAFWGLDIKAARDKVAELLLEFPQTKVVQYCPEHSDGQAFSPPGAWLVRRPAFVFGVGSH